MDESRQLISEDTTDDDLEINSRVTTHTNDINITKPNKMIHVYAYKFCVFTCVLALLLGIFMGFFIHKHFHSNFYYTYYMSAPDDIHGSFAAELGCTNGCFTSAERGCYTPRVLFN
mmetsp:Transcript_31190/g.38310  ORF Transcript_31190/g.38310 Transcript_31190/m.38310 type:complete len:116 (-) Transcript_31190:200-547(-)